jgi:hypothetical protein
LKPFVVLVTFLALVSPAAAAEKSIDAANPHQRQALWWIDQLGEEEKTAVLEPQELRTKTEYFSFQMGGGYNGFTFGFGLITIRWEEFYWELVQFRGSMGNGLLLSEATVFGYHLHLGAQARHEFRFGVGPSFIIYSREFELFGNEETDFRGLAVVPQVSYLFHVSKHFAFESVLTLVVAIVGDIQVYYPTPSPALTIGFRF